jgi:hypothetical protein
MDDLNTDIPEDIAQYAKEHNINRWDLRSPIVQRVIRLHMTGRVLPKKETEEPAWWDNGAIEYLANHPLHGVHMDTGDH